MALKKNKAINTKWAATMIIVLAGMLASAQTFDEGTWEETIEQLEYGDIDRETEENTEPVFEEDDWKDSTKDLDYGEVDDAEKEEEPEPEIESDSSSFELPTLGPVGKILVLSLVAVILIILIAKLLGNNAIGGRGRLKQERAFSIDELEENFQESDLERFLRIALENKDYQTAIRVYYLMIIKRLNELDWILWKKDKTNFDYVREVRNKPVYSMFRKLTFTFEFVWYGDFTISEQDYNAVSPEFQRIVDELNKTQHDEPAVG
jgi:hypothetical protein